MSALFQLRFRGSGRGSVISPAVGGIIKKLIVCKLMEKMRLVFTESKQILDEFLDLAAKIFILTTYIKQC